MNMSEMAISESNNEINPSIEGAMEGAQRLERRLLIALGGGVLLAVSWLGHLLGAHQLISEIPAAIGAIILVVPLLGGAWKEMKRDTHQVTHLLHLPLSQHFLLACIWRLDSSRFFFGWRISFLAELHGARNERFETSSI